MALNMKNSTNPSIKKTLVTCNDCNLDFTSQAVLDAHLQGSRHAKQMRSQNIISTLMQNNVPFSKDLETNTLKCNACNVYLNSIQQLQTHLNGNRHKKKILKDNWTNKEVISRVPPGEVPASCLPQPAARNTTLSCSSCNKYFNSQSQLNVHLASPKHLNKINGTPSTKKKRYAPYWKTNNSTSTVNAAETPLQNNFLSGGYQTSSYTY